MIKMVENIPYENLCKMVDGLKQIRSDDVFSHPVFSNDSVADLDVLEMSKPQFAMPRSKKTEIMPVNNIDLSHVDNKMHELKELSLLLNRQSDRFGILLNEVNDYRKRFQDLEASLNALRGSIPNNEHVSKRDFNETKDHFNKIFAQTLKVVHDLRIELSGFKQMLGGKSVENNFDESKIEHLNEFKKDQEQFNKKFKDNFKILNNILLQETEELRNRVDRMEQQFKS